MLAFIKDNGLIAAGAIAVIIASIDGPLPFTDTAGAAIGLSLAAIIQTVYWKESNDDGSLDVKIPYSNVITIALGYVSIKVGSHWYTYNI